MENASEALIMAGQVLLFIIALTICISSFTNLRAEADVLIGKDETVEMAKDGDQYINYMQSKENDSIRTVDASAVVSSMYRILKGDYTIYLKLKNESDYNSLDSKFINITQANHTITTNDGTPLIDEGEQIIKIKIGRDTNEKISSVLNEGKLYDYIKDKKFSEYLGEYKESTGGAVSSAEKQTKRIITYIEN